MVSKKKKKEKGLNRIQIIGIVLIVISFTSIIFLIPNLSIDDEGTITIIPIDDINGDEETISTPIFLDGDEIIITFYEGFGATYLSEQVNKNTRDITALVVSDLSYGPPQPLFYRRDSSTLTYSFFGLPVDNIASIHARTEVFNVNVWKGVLKVSGSGIVTIFKNELYNRGLISTDNVFPITHLSCMILRNVYSPLTLYEFILLNDGTEGMIGSSISDFNDVVIFNYYGALYLTDLENVDSSQFAIKYDSSVGYIST